MKRTVELQLKDILENRRAAQAAEDSAKFERKIRNLHHLVGTASVPGVYSSRPSTRPTTPSNTLLISDQALKTSQAVKERIRSATLKLRTPFMPAKSASIHRPKSTVPKSGRPLSAFTRAKPRPHSAFIIKAVNRDF